MKHNKRQDFAPILYSLLWNIGIFFLLLVFGFLSAWLFHQIGW